MIYQASEAEIVQNQAPVTPHSPKKNWFGRITAGFDKTKHKAIALGRALWQENDVWVNTAGIRGGGFAIFAAVSLVTSVITLPFTVAAIAVTGVAALAGLGAYGIFHGSCTYLHKMRNGWRRYRGMPEKEMVHKDKSGFVTRLKAKPVVQKLMQKKIIQKFMQTRVWRMTRNFTLRQQNGVMMALAIGGTAGSVAVEISIITAATMVFPIVASGVLIAGTTAFAVHGVIENIQAHKKKKQIRREKREEKKQQAVAQREALKKTAAFIRHGEGTALGETFSRADKNRKLPEKQKYSSRKTRPVRKPRRTRKYRGNRGAAL